jgi:PadR family transcriptional regulator, regulatory protein PadR
VSSDFFPSVLQQDEAHGFELLKRLEASGCGLLKLKEGSVYPALYRLERAGLVLARWEKGDSARRGPRRRLYRISAKGRRRLEKGREEWRQFVSIVGGIVGA